MRTLSPEYHDVVDPDRAGGFDSSGFAGPGPASYKLTVADFGRHLEAIARRTSRPAGRVTDWIATPRGEMPLFFTFDDGGVSAHTYIAGMLERFGWRGHFFVTGGRIGTPTFMSPAQLREMRDRGHVIGSHSFTHPARMGGCSVAQLRDEWKRSVDVLCDVLQEPIQTASVPGGFYTRPVAETASEAGIKVLFTSFPTVRTHQVHGCNVLGRYTIRRWSTPETAAALAVGSMRPRAMQWAVITALTAARHIGGDYYTALRNRIWARRG